MIIVNNPLPKKVAYIVSANCVCGNKKCNSFCVFICCLAIHNFQVVMFGNIKSQRHRPEGIHYVTLLNEGIRQCAQIALKQTDAFMLT